MKDNYLKLLLVAISLIMFLINVDYTAINLALIPMSQDLHTNLTTIQWVLSGYVLAWAVLVIPAGSSCDIYPKKYVCMTGLILFLLASLLAGFAHSATMLIFSRMLQGMAGALYIPATYGLIYVNFPKEQCGRAIGILSLGVGVGMAVGPFLGGVLLSTLGWRSIFFLNIPIVLLVLMVLGSGKNHEVIPKKSFSLSKISALTLAMPIVITLYLLGQWKTWQQHQILYTGLMVLALLAFIIFIRLQKKLTQPLIPLKLFSNLSFLGCGLGVLLEQYNFSAIIVGLGLYLQKVLKVSLFQCSVIYLFLSVVFGVIAAFGGRVIDRVGLRLPTIGGLLVLGLGSFWFVAFSPAHLGSLFVILSVIGVGMGFAFAGLNTGILKAVSSEQVGIASAIFVMFALLGNAFGVAITALLYEQKSLNQLLQSLANIFHELTSQQVQQISYYIAEIGNQQANLSAFVPSMHATILEMTPKALAYGIHNALLISAALSLLAAFICSVTLQKNPKKIADQIIEENGA
jgi:EmrB/QacA subfamily drug resistance transporter